MKLTESQLREMVRSALDEARGTRNPGFTDEQIQRIRRAASAVHQMDLKVQPPKWVTSSREDLGARLILTIRERYKSTVEGGAFIDVFYDPSAEDDETYRVDVRSPGPRPRGRQLFFAGGTGSNRQEALELVIKALEDWRFGPTRAY